MVWTKDSITKFVDQILWWRQKAVEEDNTIYFDVWDDNIFNSTQKDKPTPHSSMTIATAIDKARKVFPSLTYKISTISNTNSMEPLMDDNCIVVLEKITESVLRRQPIVVGDVCVWNKQGRKIIHRILRISDSGKSFYFQGDNNFFADGWIPITLVESRLAALFYCKARRDND